MHRVYVCVRVRERESDRENERERGDKSSQIKSSQTKPN